jgi:hypothetical protein
MIHLLGQYSSEWRNIEINIRLGKDYADIYLFGD